MPSLLSRIANLESHYAQSADIKKSVDFSVYMDDPVGFVRKELGQNPTPDQEAILRSAIEPPYKTLVPSAHNCGKSWTAACLILWGAKCFGDDFRINSTASTYDQINEAVWGEVRSLDFKCKLGLMGGVAPIIKRGPKGIAKGFTAKTPTAFQGRRGLYNGLIVDEAIGIDPTFFPAMESIYGGKRYFGVFFFNPTDPSSHLRLKEESHEYRVIKLSQETHPNIIAARWGKPIPYPSAITLEVFEKQMRERSDPVIGEPMPQDVLIGWKFNEHGEKVGGEWRRPNYEADCRNLGRWPSVAAVAIWTPALFDSCCMLVRPLGGRLQIGVDVARYGNCNSAFVVRKGNNVLRLESYNGWNTTQIAERAKELCFEFGRLYGEEPRMVPVAIDDTGGWGAGVIDQRENYNFVGVIAGERAWNEDKYFLKRDEMWCALRDSGNQGTFSMAMLPRSQQQLLRPQALAAKYEYRGLRKKVLPKEQMAESLNGRSPDEWEAVQLAFVPIAGVDTSEQVTGRVRAG